MGFVACIKPSKLGVISINSNTSLTGVGGTGRTAMGFLACIIPLLLLCSVLKGAVSPLFGKGGPPIAASKAPVAQPRSYFGGVFSAKPAGFDPTGAPASSPSTSWPLAFGVWGDRITAHWVFGADTQICWPRSHRIFARGFFLEVYRGDSAEALSVLQCW